MDREPPCKEIVATKFASRRLHVPVITTHQGRCRNLGFRVVKSYRRGGGASCIYQSGSNSQRIVVDTEEEGSTLHRNVTICLWARNIPKLMY